MIDNTIKAIETITGQLKSIDVTRKFMTLIIYIAYLLYRIIAGNGYLALNVSLLVLTAAYLTFYVCYVSMKKGAFKPKTVLTVNRIYRWTKLVFAAIGMGLSISGFLAVAQDSTSATNLIFAITVPIFFVLQLVCDILFEYANYCFALLKTAVAQDVENIKATYEKPIKVVKSVKETVDGIKSFTGGIKGIAKSIFSRGNKSDREEVAASDDSQDGIE